MNRKAIESIIKPKLSARLKGKQAHIDACEVLAKARVAAINGNRKEVVEEVVFHLRRSEKYHFNTVALGLSRFLHSYYTIEKSDKTKANYYKKIRSKYIHRANIEELVDYKLLEFSEKINAKKYPTEFRNQLSATCKELDEYLSLESAPISVKIYMLKIALAYINNDYNLVIQHCLTIIKWLESKSFAWFASFYYYLVPALIIQRKYQEGRMHIKKAMGNVNRKSTNWDSFAFARFLLETHEGNYQEAYTQFKKVERKTIHSNILKERWLIAKAYLSFLIQTGAIQAKGNFKFGKFLNEVPLSSVDKTGSNVDILILSIILRLQHDRGWIIDHKETIEKYIQRYLSGRSKIFMKMLISMVRYDFDAEKLKAGNQGNLNRLEQEAGRTTEIISFEVVPYERLWGMVLGVLG